MAGPDKKTLLRDAVRFVQKGQLDKAIEVYRAVAKADPKDGKVHNDLGDLYIRQGKKKEAIAEYLETANLYEKDGFALRAIALCQKILNLDPEVTPVRLKLADLYSGQKLAAEARAQYLQVANWFDKKGEVANALDVFRRIADLEPDNLAVRVKLAGMFEKQKFPEKAAAEYARAARGALAKGDTTAAVQLFVRAYKLHPGNPDARRGLVDYHRERKDWPVVVGLLQPLVARGTRETELVVMYADALTRVGHAREAAGIVEKVREREPNDPAVNLVLGRALVAAGDVPAGIAALHRVVGSHLAENRAEQAEALLREMAKAAPEDETILQRLLELAQRRGDRGGADAAGLALAGVHERRGRHREAAELLAKHLEAHPDDAAAAERLEALREQVAPPAASAAPEALVAAPAEPEAPPPAAAVPPAATPAPKAPPVAAAPPAEPAPVADVDVIEIDLEGEEFAESELEEAAGEEAVLELEEAGVEAGTAAPAVLTTVEEAAAAIREGAAGKAAAFLEDWLGELPYDAEAASLLVEARKAQGGGAPLRDALLRLAAIHRRAGNLEEARFACQDALAADPRSSAAALTLTQIVLEEERAAQAAEAEAAPAPPPAAATPPVARPEAPPPPEPVAPAEELEVELSFGEEAPAAALVEAPPAPELAAPAIAEPPPGEEHAPVAEEPPAAEIPDEINLEGLAPEEAAPAAAPAEPEVPVEAPPAAGAPVPEEDASSPAFWSDLLDLTEPAPAAAAPEAAPGAKGVPGGIGEDLDAFELLEEAAPAPAPAAPLAPPAPVAEAPAGVPPPGGGAEIDEFLAEADFYFQQGLLDEAEFLYRKLLRLAPGRPEIGEQIRRLEAVRRESQAASPPPPPAPAAEPPEPEAAPIAAAAPAGPLDFSEFLSDLKQEIESSVLPAVEPAPEQVGEEGLNEIFKEFQRNVREQLGEEDFETHYNLGIAYKEMGLMEEALGEFALAERSPARRGDALSMVALCLREMGRYDDAAARLEAGIGEVAEGGEQQKGFLYDLAAVHELAGRPEAAQETLRRLVAIDAGYRDAAARLRPEAPPVAAAPPPRRKPRVGYL